MKAKVLLILGLILTFPPTFGQSVNFEVIRKEAKNINIEINTKLELFLIMAHLDDHNYEYLNKFDYEYKKDIDNYFDSYKQDKNVAYINKVLQNYNSHLNITQFIFDTEFRKNVTYSNFLNMNALGIEHSLDSWNIVLHRLNHAVEQFAISSNFKEFVTTHKDYYIQKVNEVATAVSKLNMIDDFYEFWGFKKDNYSIVISMLETDIHALWFDNTQGSNCLFVLSPKFVVNHDAVFGNSDQTDIMNGKMTAKDYIYYAATHELGHPILDPLLDNYADMIEEIPFKISTFSSSRIVFLSESFLRTLTAYYMQKDKKEDLAKILLQAEIAQGYIYSDDILKLIYYYSENRNKYKNFEEYIPDFLKSLKECVLP